MNKWTKTTQHLIKQLEKIEPKDRLSLCSGIVSCNFALARSVNGWTSWLADPRTMELMTEEELQEIFGEFRKFAITFLKLDMEVTEKYGVKEATPKTENPMVI